jgi:hypothetical protein
MGDPELRAALGDLRELGGLSRNPRDPFRTAIKAQVLDDPSMEHAISHPRIDGRLPVTATEPLSKAC